MSLAEFSIRRPVAAWMLMSFIVILGAIGLNRLGLGYLPDVDYPIVTTTITWKGSSPDMMETEVADPLEEAFLSIEGIKSVDSQIRFGKTTIIAEFFLETDLNRAFQDIQAKIGQTQSKLPRDIDPPQVTKTNPEDSPVVFLALHGDKTISERELILFAETKVKDQFSSVPGVGEIGLNGRVPPAMRIRANPRKLIENDISLNDVINSILKEHTNPPAGQTKDSEKEANVRIFAEAITAKNFGDLPILSRGNQPNFRSLKIKDIAEVSESTEEVTQNAFFKGKRAIVFTIKKQQGANTVALSDGINERLAQVRKSLPPEYKLDLIIDSAIYTREAVDELKFSLLLACILTSLVCWLFLGSISHTFNIMLSIPTSILGTFTVLYFTGMTLNIFTLLGLSLAVGLVVDDAIMILESINRKIEEGMEPVKAAIEGTKQVQLAAMAASFSIVAIFLPVIFMKGIIGKYFLQLGVTVTAAILLSLVEALTLTPMRASKMKALNHQKPNRMMRIVHSALSSIENFYESMLRWSLNHRLPLLMSFVLILVGSAFIGSKLGRELLPPEDQGRGRVIVKGPLGRPLIFMQKKMEKVAEILKHHPDIDRYIIVNGGFAGGESNVGLSFFVLKEKEHRLIRPSGKHFNQVEVLNDLREKFSSISEVTFGMQDLSQSSIGVSAGRPVEFKLKGGTYLGLADEVSNIISSMNDSKLFKDIDSGLQMNMPEMQLTPKHDELLKRGVTTRDVAEILQASFGGKIIAEHEFEGRKYDVWVDLMDGFTPEERLNLLRVNNYTGETTGIKNLVESKMVLTPLSLQRSGRQRAVTILASLGDGVTQDQAITWIDQTLRTQVDKKFNIELSGNLKQLNEIVDDLLLAFALALIFTYMILAAQFNSFLDPLIVISAIPFGLAGAFVGLYFTHQSLNIYSMIGVVLLVGLVVKNSILLVDVIRQKGEGLDSIIEGSKERLRPILMTSVATVVGMLPVVFSFGPGAESRVPMGVAVVAGIIVSTFVTLFLVPILINIIHGLKMRKS